jgi:hypothetical protein
VREIVQDQGINARAYELSNPISSAGCCGKDGSMTGLPTGLSTESVDHLRSACGQIASVSQSAGLEAMTDTMAFAATVHDAVKLAGIGRTGLYRLIGEGAIKAKKSGRRTLS